MDSTRRSLSVVVVVEGVANCICRVVADRGSRICDRARDRTGAAHFVARVAQRVAQLLHRIVAVHLRLELRHAPTELLDRAPDFATDVGQVAPEQQDAQHEQDEHLLETERR